MGLGQRRGQVSVRTLAIGDIHGNSVALDALMHAVQPTPADLLVFLGDYVDRGPDSKGVLDRLISWKQHVQMICLRGNHELMMCRALCDHNDRRNWMHVGGTETIASYAVAGRAGIESIPEEHWKFLDNDLYDFLETDTHIFAHANLEPDTPLEEQPELNLFWEFLAEPVKHFSGKTLICGHTRQLSGVPKAWPTTVCIDTAIYKENGWLTGLNVETGSYWQANATGEVRMGELVYEETE
jgi:serine/threonine protein phosphatase 1